MVLIQTRSSGSELCFYSPSALHAWKRMPLPGWSLVLQDPSFISAAQQSSGVSKNRREHLHRLQEGSSDLREFSSPLQAVVSSSPQRGEGVLLAAAAVFSLPSWLPHGSLAENCKRRLVLLWSPTAYKETVKNLKSSDCERGSNGTLYDGQKHFMDHKALFFNAVVTLYSR